MIEEFGNKEEEELRRYLLGKMPEAEMEALEKRLMKEDALFEMLNIVEEEILDARAAGEPTAEDQGRADEYFFASSDRQRRLAFARALRAQVERRLDETLPAETSSPGRAPGAMSDQHVGLDFQGRFGLLPRRRSRVSSASWVGYAGLAAATVILTVSFIWIWAARKGDIDAVALLSRAYERERPTEAIICGFDYAPPPPKTRGSEKGKFDYAVRDHAEALIREELATRPGARSFHDAGRLSLAQHDFARAIEELEKALTLEPNNAQIENDLGVAYLEKWASSSPSEDRLSLYTSQHLHRAIELDNNLLPALFNLALSYERLDDKEQASLAWNSYLKEDPTSKWADEAREHLNPLGK